MTEYTQPEVEPPSQFSADLSQFGEEVSSGPTEPYWHSYQVSSLDSMMERALGDNFSLQEALSRIERSRASAQIATSGLFPEVTVEASGSRARIETGELILAQGFRPVGDIYQTQFGLSNGLSYELDIWERVASGRRAELFRQEAATSDYENAILLVSSDLFNEWLRAIESRQLEEVLKEQIESSETFLDLTELRFSLSQGTALDVFEQRQQVASLRTQVPLVLLAGDQAVHRLAVLTGNTPGTVKREELPMEYPVLPEKLPNVTPVDLIQLRPDLRAFLYRLQANEYDVAAAFADRFPRLSIGFNYDFQTSELESLFPNKVLSGFGGILLPLIDGGRRRGVVDLEEAEVKEAIAQFSERYLVALQEVEDALAAERHQKELLKNLSLQLEAANNTLAESKSRYVNGLTDYLRVLLALQSTQNLEREVISQKRQLLVFRNQLYLALGGKMPKKLKEPSPINGLTGNDKSSTSQPHPASSQSGSNQRGA